MRIDQRKALYLSSAVALLSIGLLIGQAAPAHVEEHVSRFRGMLSLVNDFAATAQNPSATAIAAVMGLEEHLPDPAARIAHLQEQLPRVSDPTVQRIIRVTLADLYKKTGNREKAMEQLDRLIINRPQAD